MPYFSCRAELEAAVCQKMVLKTFIANILVESTLKSTGVHSRASCPVTINTSYF